MDPTSTQGGSSGEMGQQKRAELLIKPSSPDSGRHGVPEKAATGESLEVGPIGPSNAGPAAAPSTAPGQLPPVTAQATAPVTASATDDTPLVAADDELLEKEWVEKAKKIVAQTKDDPYSQEKEVSKLQADYIKKRYGKDIKLSSD